MFQDKGARQETPSNHHTWNNQTSHMKQRIRVLEDSLSLHPAQGLVLYRYHPC